MIYLGIDPGMTGAIAAICVDAECTGVRVHDLPTETRISYGKDRKCIDIVRFAVLLQSFGCDRDTYATIERPAIFEPKPGQPFKIGQEKLLITYGHLEAALWALNIETQDCYPISWQSYFGLRGTGKAGSLQLARQMWPQIDLSRKKDNNKAEALLIAEWGRQQKTGGVRPTMHVNQPDASRQELAQEPF